MSCPGFHCSAVGRFSTAPHKFRHQFSSTCNSGDAKSTAECCLLQLWAAKFRGPTRAEAEALKSAGDKRSDQEVAAEQVRPTETIHKLCGYSR